MSGQTRRRTWLIAVLAHIAVLVGAIDAVRAQAPAESWLVVETSGDVERRAAEGAWQALAAGDALPIGTAVTTGGDGRVVLTHQGDVVTVSANSALELRAAAAADPGPSILQSLGTLLFRVDHRPGRRFEVQTPYLAAVVKGTVFTVSIRATENSVHVAEGAVEVTNLGDHQSVLTRPGETAMVAPRGKGVSILGASVPAAPRRSDALPSSQAPQTAATASSDPQPVASDSADGGPRLTAARGQLHLDIAALTHGLVQGSGITAFARRNAAADGGTSAASPEGVPPLLATVTGTGSAPEPSAGVASNSASASPVAAVTGTVGAVTGTVGAVGGAVGGAAGGLGANPVGALTGAVGGTVGAVGGVTGAVGGAVGGLGANPVGALTGAVGGTVGATGGAVGGVTGAVGGAVGGTTGNLLTATGNAAGSVTNPLAAALGAVTAKLK